MLAADCNASAVAALPCVRQCGAHVVQFAPAAWQEEDGIAAAWFARHGAVAALVRPDHYVYGAASTFEEIAPLSASYHAACVA